jgi:alpha-1,6-mannosyltransferase
MSESPPVRRPDALGVLVVAGSIELILLATMGWWDGATMPWMGLVLFGGAFLAYAFAGSKILDSSGGHLTIWIFAILMRVALLPLVPELSEDIYRYLWDGEVQLAGINPYHFAPNAGAVADVHLGPMLVENPGLRSVFPPFAQVAFLAIAAVGGAIFQAKLLWLGLDLGTGWLLGRVSVITGRSRRLTQLLYLWSPLLLVEVAWNANYAPLGLFALVLVVLLARAPGSAGIATGFSGLVGFMPFAAAPVLTRRLGMKYFFGVLAGTAVLAAPYATRWREYGQSMSAFMETWSSMRGPYTLFEAAIPAPIAARYAVVLMLLAVMGWTVFQRYRPERALLWMIGACLILAPGFRPSYALWILPLAALRANKTWLLFTGVAFLAYAGLTEFEGVTVNTQPLWARLLLWVPFLVLLVLDAARLWQERVPPPKELSERRTVARD